MTPAGRIQKSHDRIQHEQDGAGFAQSAVKDVGVRRQAEGTAVIEEVLVEDESAVEVRTEGAQARLHGVLALIFAVEDDDVGRPDARRAVGHGPAGGDAGAEVEGDERLADFGIAVEDAEFAAGQPVGQQPGQRAGRTLARRAYQRKRVHHSDLEKDRWRPPRLPSFAGKALPE